MLREAKSTIKKEKLVLYNGETKRKRKARKSLKKGKSKGKWGKTNVAKNDPTKEKGQCFHYDKDRNWMRNYKEYLIKKGKTEA